MTHLCPNGHGLSTIREIQFQRMSPDYWHCDSFHLIGWDIGLGVEGPIAIEGNWNSGTEII